MRLLPQNPLLGFLFRLFAFYALFVFPWPGLKSGYAEVFRTSCERLFGSPVEGAVVTFRAPATEQRAWDIEMRVRDVRRGVGWHMEYSSRSWGYLSTAATAALILATPFPWRRRAVTLAVGLFLVHLFIALRVAIGVAYALLWGSFFTPGAFWGKTIETICLAVSASPVASFVGPVVIWLLTLRKGDWAMFFARQADGD